MYIAKEKEKSVRMTNGAKYFYQDTQIWWIYLLIKKKNKNELVSVYLSVYTSNNIINLPIKEKESNQMFEYSTYI